MKTVLILALAAPLLATAAGWENISDPLTSKVKPGDAGPTAGVTADRVSGDVFMVVNDQGLWKSSDHGTTFSRMDDGSVGGRCETSWALQADPNGRRLFCFMIYGGSAMTVDGGKTWLKSTTSHLDFGAVDWEDTGQRVLAIRHESGGMLTTSDDGGATWKDLAKGFSGCGVFDRSTFVTTKANQKGIFRSADAGVTWTQVFTNTPAGAVPMIFKRAGYYTTGTGILASRDKGMTWSALGAPVDAGFGPYFGETEVHFVVVGTKGFQETKDGGKTWRPAAPLPPGFGGGHGGPLYPTAENRHDNFAWDPNADIFYASTMTKPTLKFKN